MQWGRGRADYCHWLTLCCAVILLQFCSNTDAEGDKVLSALYPPLHLDKSWSSAHYFLGYCVLLVKHDLLFPASPKTWQDLSLRPVVCFPWSCGSQPSSGSSTIKVAAFLATRLCPALISPGTEPCRHDLDAAQPAWSMAQRIPHCLGLPWFCIHSLWIYTQSMEGNDPETVFFTQSSLVNIMKSYSAAVKFSSPNFQFKAITTSSRNWCIPVLGMVITYLAGVAWYMEEYVRSSQPLSISTVSRDKWDV